MLGRMNYIAALAHPLGRVLRMKFVDPVLQHFTVEAYNFMTRRK